ncbi:hypothetical protein C2W62_22145 [Candidatus Entotheonella serta]|nr:hypothetical protein C2W62_22145 [Candidatus Entotheonella serta]
MDAINMRYNVKIHHIGAYFRAQRLSGSTPLPGVYKLYIDETLLVLDTEFFAPLRDQPLHIVIRIRR